MKKEVRDLICIKRKLKSLKRSKEKRCEDIINSQQSFLNKVDNIEDVDRSFFEEIENKIKVVERLIKIKEIKNNKK